ncbi:hypothetical protein BGZ73_008478 [Actinomortierella ambigua]|nr:hypothetical protein BGZ73_008478 [Actinomortierella ambigua]
MYPVIPVVAACTALIPLLVMLVGRRSFRTLPPMREFSLFKMIKTTVVAAYRYSSASATERATTGHWLNFAAKDHGSLFVQEVYDFGLSVFHILVPVFFFSMLSGLYVKSVNNATSLQTAWAFYMFTYSTVVAILLVNFVTIPLLERRGWKVSLHRRFGAGYVCLLVAFGLSLIVNKVALDAFKSAAPSMVGPGETVESILEDPGYRQCPSCVSQWAVFPQYVFLALANALVVPTAYHIVYIESGRRLRTFAMAILLVAISMSGRVNVVSNFRPNSDQIGRAHYVYGGLAVAGLVLYLITTRFYTPRKVRPSINEAARQAKEAEYSKL